MRFDELDLAAGNWSIPGRKTKNLQGQVIPLGPTEIAILKERRELLKAAGIIGPYLFPGDGKTGHVQDIKRSWTTLRKRLEISDVTVHDLRRSLAASMASQNVNVSLIKSALNHKDLKTTLSVYAMTSKQAELEARQLAQSVWIKAAEQLPAGNAVKQLKKATK
jgi:integrase